MRKLALAAAALLAGVGTFAPAAAPAAFAATNPKVAIIVGAVHGLTPNYRSYADKVYAEAIKYTNNVVRVYSPNATWTRVKAAVNGASIVVYMGHGNGWPSPYTYDPNYTTKDGFGLNYDLNGDGKLSDYENKYYGEPSIATLTPAPNAVVLLFHLCYAAGNSEPGLPAPTTSVARQRADNYGAGFLKAGARAVLANGHSQDPYYIRALFTTHQTMDQYFRNAPDYHGHVRSYPSVRTAGMTLLQDPESAAPANFYRSIVGKLSLTTESVTGASYASTSGDPSTFVVPGNATPAADGAPVFGSVETAVSGTDPVATLPSSVTVRIDARETGVAGDGSAVFRVRTDAGVTGWMRGSSLVPRDSAAPRLWTVEDGSGAFSPNGDGSQDSIPVSLRLSESTAWTLRIVNGGGTTLTTASGTGDVPAITWSPAAGSVPDGTYEWSLTASDAWGNGPLAATGAITVDTEAPSVSVADGVAATVPQFTPNGDGSRDTIGFAVASSEPGSVVGTALDGAGHAIASFSVGVGTSGGTLTWDGRTAGGGHATDGFYTVSVAAKDRAGNLSAPQTRAVDLYGSLGYVKTSSSLFFPQDGDALAPSTTFSFVLGSPASVSWAVVNALGVPVRTVKADEALAAGTYSFVWNGRDDLGAMAPRGVYYSRVTASNGAQTAVQLAGVRLDAFRVVSSDTTPARLQRITVTVTSAEPLGTAPRLRVYQPGLAAWTVSMARVSTSVYRVTITLKSSAAGSLKLQAYANDSKGAAQGSSIFLPLH